MEDWKAILSHSITSLSALKQFTDDYDPLLEEVTAKYPFRITPYYFGLIKEKNDPIWKQCIPDIRELVKGNCLTDPLAEERLCPVPHIVHKYPDRVLFLVSSHCPVYCRFCTRKRKVGMEKMRITAKTIEQGIAYIKENRSVREVLLSGGDPLILGDEQLDRILWSLSKIPTLEVIRIGSRVPCTLPMRITDDLLSILRKYRPLYINTHFNHPRELTPQAETACNLLADNGIVMGCQTVLLKDVNDNADVLKTLFTGLLKNRVKPYYLFQGDLTAGTDHFRTPIKTGLQIMKQLYGHISGMAIPTYALDGPGGAGKIPLTPEYVLKNKKALTFTNYLGKECYYPDM